MVTALLTDSVTPDLDRAVHYTLLWGLEGVALRTLGRGERVPHVNEARLRRRVDEAELPIVAVDPGLFEGSYGARASWLNDLAAFGETARFCERVGCPVVITGALAGVAGEPWDAREAGVALARLAEEAHSAGLRLAVRNDDGTACQSGHDLAAALGSARAACGSDEHMTALGAAWNPTAALRAGADPADGLEALMRAGVPVHYVAVDDTTSDDVGWQSAAPGAGDVGWALQIQQLVTAGCSAPLALEVHGRPAGPSGLRASNALRELIRAAQWPATS